MAAKSRFVRIQRPGSRLLFDEITVRRTHEHAPRWCISVDCGKPIPGAALDEGELPPLGRPREYCSARCRAREAKRRARLRERGYILLGCPTCESPLMVTRDDQGHLRHWRRRDMRRNLDAMLRARLDLPPPGQREPMSRAAREHLRWGDAAEP